MTIIDVGPSIWLYTLRIAALIGAPSGSGRSKGEFWMFAFATGWIEADDRCHRGFPMGDYRQGRPPDLVLLASAGMVFVILFGGLLYFNKMESTIADVV
jgi:hypothetical protein